MKLFTVIALAVALCISLASVAQKVTFDEDNHPKAPDYSQQASWAALPGLKNYSDSTPVAGLEKAEAKADVFFIYPTSYIGLHEPEHYWNADIHDDRINKATCEGSILCQASVFNICCNIYAPYYRQAHLEAFFDARSGLPALQLAYSDVRRAFEYYLQHFNHGRPIIIASHSQGSVHAQWLLKDFFNGKPLYKQLVTAYIVGFPVNPDSFKYIPPCCDSVQTGCYCTWNSFKYGYTPVYYNAERLNNAICTNPLTWTTKSDPASSRLNLGGVLNHFDTVYTGLCDAEVHNGMLWVHPPRVGKFFFKIMKIYHIVDYNLFYMNIRRNVKQRVDNYLKNTK